jgi:lipoprotein-anchoring transpeptidase ErfK/SrfK
MRRSVAALVSVTVAVVGGAAAASHAPPWVEPGAQPVAAWVRSARVLKADQPILAEPDGNAPRRGSARLDVRLPLFAARAGGGCRERWLEVGPRAWMCGDAAELSGNPFVGAHTRTAPTTADGLPYRYFFVGPDGSFGYRKIEAADVGEPDMQLDPGFAVAVVEERVLDGARYGRTNNQLWLPMRDLGPVFSLAFRGEEIPPNATGVPVAWVIVDKARVFARPTTAAPTSASRARFEVVKVLEDVSGFAGSFVRIGEAEWLEARNVRHPTLAEPPPEVDISADERWIDIDLATQTLVALEGRRPVFATLVSSGKGRQGAYNATPKGTNRVWVKLLTSNMDNLEDENAARYYRMEDVPYVQYFSKGVGVHGAFWHRSFGHVRSHGCVNVTPLDAQRLFWWTAPHLPAGWTAVLPTEHELGTVVRVR